MEAHHSSLPRQQPDSLVRMRRQFNEAAWHSADRNDLQNRVERNQVENCKWCIAFDRVQWCVVAVFLFDRAELEMLTFGRNDFGQLGRTDQALIGSVQLPEECAGGAITGVACGSEHTTCSVVVGGNSLVLAWGWNEHFQLARAGENSAKPTVVLITRGRVQVACGGGHSVVLVL
jgi:alpha-tubulin suppressor-like RCC1 family protein